METVILKDGTVMVTDDAVRDMEMIRNLESQD